MRLSVTTYCLMIIVLSFTGNKLRAQNSLFLAPLTTKNKFNKSSKYISSGSLSVSGKDSVKMVPMQSRLPFNFYSAHLGAACKMELQLEKQTGLPIRIRLGSKEQVDYLEGKFSRNR